MRSSQDLIDRLWARLVEEDDLAEAALYHDDLKAHQAHQERARELAAMIERREGQFFGKDGGI